MSFTAETYPHIKSNTKILIQFRSKTILSENMIRHPHTSFFSGHGNTV